MRSGAFHDFLMACIRMLQAAHADTSTVMLRRTRAPLAISGSALKEGLSLIASLETVMAAVGLAAEPRPDDPFQ